MRSAQGLLHVAQGSSLPLASVRSRFERRCVGKEESFRFPKRRIEEKILIVRGQRVMLDTDLAEIYGVTTYRLNEQVTRNIDRFPEDFCYRLTKEEFKSLTSHSAMSKRGGRRRPPRVFTEHGAVMLASVLRTSVAVEASVQVVRALCGSAR